MKTQVIKLEVYDDIVSIRDKMSWAKTDRIILVLPRRARLLSRTLDLRLLRRHAEQVGARLALVTFSPDLRQRALQEGIPSFFRLSSAKRLDWKPTRTLPQELRRHETPDLQEIRHRLETPPPGWSGSLAARLVFFILGVLALLTVALAFVPSATVQLTPATRTQSLAVSVSASPDFEAVTLAGDLPARQLTTTLELTKSASATGSINLPVSSATGTAEFRNLATAALTIPAGTVIATLSSPAVRFATTVEAQLPAGFGKMVEVSIQAVDGGVGGNLPADSLVAIEGELGASLSVTNPDPTRGGTDHLAAIQTAKDRSSLRAALMQSILDQCGTILQKTLQPGDVYLPDSLGVSKVIDETYFPGEGQAGDTLTLTLHAECQVRYVLAADLATLAGELLDLDLPAGYTAQPATLQLQQTSKPVTDSGGITRWQVTASRTVQSRIDLLQVQQLCLGRRPATALARLDSSLSLSGTPSIRLTPPWWPWLPLIPFRITLAPIP